MVPATAPTAAPDGREDALDALRAGAMLLCVFFHAAVPFVRTPRSGLLWPVAAAQGNRLLDAFFWTANGFQMPLFFLLSGLLAGGALARRGARAFVAGRLRRLVLPFLAPGVPVLAALFYTWSAGWWLEGRCTAREIRAVKFADPVLQDGFLGPAHLWFLEDLLAASLALAAGRRLLPRLHARVVVTAGVVGGAAVLFASPAVVTAFSNRFVPDPFRLAFHALFFVAGAALASPGPRPSSLDRARSCAAPLLAAAAAAGAGAYVVLPDVAGGSAGILARATFAAASSAFAWAASLAALALVRGRRLPPGPRLSALCEASYWVYLVHLPVVGALHLALVPLGWPVTTWAVSGCGALSLALLLWRPVRRTGLGALLAAGPARS